MIDTSFDALAMPVTPAGLARLRELAATLDGQAGTVAIYIPETGVAVLGAVAFGRLLAWCMYPAASESDAKAPACGVARRRDELPIGFSAPMVH